MVALIIMGAFVAGLAALLAYGYHRLHALDGAPHREPGEQRPDVIRSGLGAIWPRG